MSDIQKDLILLYRLGIKILNCLKHIYLAGMNTEFINL